MTLFYVSCDELSSLWDTYDKAKAYILGEAKRYNWELIYVDYDDKEAEKHFLENLYTFQSVYGDVIEAHIIPLEVNSKPYIERGNTK